MLLPQGADGAAGNDLAAFASLKISHRLSVVDRQAVFVFVLLVSCAPPRILQVRKANKLTAGYGTL
jgi:hypothetical protein